MQMKSTCPKKGLQKNSTFGNKYLKFLVGCPWGSM